VVLPRGVYPLNTSRSASHQSIMYSATLRCGLSWYCSRIFGIPIQLTYTIFQVPDPVCASCHGSFVEKVRYPVMV